MTKNKTRFFLFALSMIFAACISAKTYIVDYQGSEMGADYPKWVPLLEDAVGDMDSGKIEYSKKVKKLYKNLVVETGKTLYFAIQESSDKDIAKVKAGQAARAAFSLEREEEYAQVSGLKKVTEFWQKETDGGDEIYRYYIVFEF